MAGLLAVFLAGAPVLVLEEGTWYSGPVQCVFVVHLLAGVLLGAGMAAHWVLERRRSAGWEAEWAVIEPRWTRPPLTEPD